MLQRCSLFNICSIEEFTCICIMVSVQSCELFAIVPGKGVSSIAMVAAHP